MSCYHPLLMTYDGLSDSGKPSYKFLGVQGEHEKKYEKRDPRDILIPCRKCIGCRLDYSRRWADRLMIELDHSKTAVFLTLTYDNDNATIGMYDDVLNTVWYTLVKKDVQDFNKRLRFYFSGKEIRFYLAGEYGDNTLRPHYHGIYFGLSLDDFPDKELIHLNHANQPVYTSDKLSKIWKNGFVSIANVSWQSCAYVARYNLKKLGAGSDGSAESRGCIPEFSLMSRQPGIGGYFVYDHPEFFQNPRDEIVISDSFGVRNVKSVRLPNYLLDKINDVDNPDLLKLGIANPELYAIIKEERLRASEDSFFKELSNTNLNEFDYLSLKERNHEKASRLLKRSL